MPIIRVPKRPRSMARRCTGTLLLNSLLWLATAAHGLDPPLDRSLYTTSVYQTSYTSFHNDTRIHRRHSHTKAANDFYTHLSDVGFCLAMALGWTVWMLSSFLKSDLSKYQSGSVVVRGHVLKVSVEGDSLGMGIPTYKATIDYIVPDLKSKDEDEEEEAKIQIRKQFETQQQLEEGFANVELLVLPHEPTYSVLREDWEKEWEYQVEDYEWWRTAWFRRLTMAVTGFLVLASVGGAVHVVIRLDPTRRAWGWALICIGVPLLLPTALTIHKCMQVLQKVLTYQSESAGVVIRGADRLRRSMAECEDLDYLDARACDDEGAPQDFRSVKSTVDETAGCYFIRFPKSKAVHHRDPFPESGSIAASNDSGAVPEDSVSSVSSISIQDRQRSDLSA